MSADKHQTGTDPELQERLRRIGLVILIAGALAAALVFLRAGPDGAPASDRYELVNGVVYPVAPGESKSDAFQAEQLGGAANVVASEFREWLGSLWHGRKLAYTLAFLAFGGSLPCFFLAHRLAQLAPPEERSGPEGR